MQHFAQFFVGCAILALGLCAPVYNSDFDRKAHTAIDTRSMSPDGNYYYNYYLDTGATQEVIGTLNEVNGVQFYSVAGSYSYYLGNGKRLTVEYIAGENGYQILSFKEEVQFYSGPSIDSKAMASLLGR